MCLGCGTGDGRGRSIGCDGSLLSVLYHLPRSLILPVSYPVSAPEVVWPLCHLSSTTERRGAYGGISPRGCTRSAGLSTMAARLRCMAQPKFQYGWFEVYPESHDGPRSFGHSPHGPASAIIFV